MVIAAGVQPAAESSFIMRVIIQRVNSSSVAVHGRVVGEIGHGLMALVGFGAGDDESKLAPMAEKIANMRLFPDDRSHFNLSLQETKGGILAVPQFTLYADTTKGRRPDFTKALGPEKAAELFDKFVSVLRSIPGLDRIETGEFGAHMQVSLVNDGPVTITLES
jgi:D-aminoacyl-tRNA deacylase